MTIGESLGSAVSIKMVGTAQAIAA